MSEKRNAVSIVLQLEYLGRKVLFAGDVIGRAQGDPDDRCGSAESMLVRNHSIVSIKSDVLIAPHHGSDGGSSSCFISAVDRSYVIFSSGHNHQHPRDSTVKRYISAGVPVQNIFRTDFGDHEGGREWEHGQIQGCRDRAGDDHVVVVISSDDLVVRYRDTSVTPC